MATTISRTKNRHFVYRLPSDPEEKKRWLQAIPRDNIPLTKDTTVCERHWKKEYPSVMCFGKPRPRDPPSEFFCVKSSLVPTPAPLPRATTKALSSKRNKKDDELSAFMEKDKIRSLDEIC